MSGFVPVAEATDVHATNVNVDLNESEVSDARAEFYSGEVDYVVFAYKPKTHVLKVQDSGKGGMAEVLDNLSDGKIAYILMKIDGSVVFISYAPSGCPPVLRGVVPGHQDQIKEWLRAGGITLHDSFHATDEKDFDPEDGAILAKLRKNKA